METVNRKIDRELGEFLRFIVKKVPCSQEKWAEQLNVSPRVISYYCSGERKPSLRILLRMMRIAGIRPEDIPF